MTDEPRPPFIPDGSDHPSIVDLSLLVDGVLPEPQLGAVDLHLRRCDRCRGDLAQLSSARAALAGASHPVAPAGAADRAVAAAMSVTLLPGAGAADRAVAAAMSVTSLPGVADEARAPAAAHRRYVLARQAAAAVIIAGGVGAGVVALVRSDHRGGTATAGPAQTTSPADGGKNMSPTSTVHNGPYGGPVAGGVVLQLRAEIGPDSCAQTGARGRLGGASPPAAEEVTVAGAGGASCILLGPAFAVVSSSNVTHVSLHNRTAGNVAVTIHAGTTAVTSATRLRRAIATGATIDVVGGGVDLGPAVVVNGPVITVVVSQSIAKILAQDLP
jgi:hypothetical protein